MLVAAMTTVTASVAAAMMVAAVMVAAAAVMTTAVMMAAAAAVNTASAITSVTITVIPTAAAAGNYLVAVKIDNAGYAAADVPVTVRSGSGDDARSFTQRLHIPARGKATARILILGKPTEVQVNDGTVPETQASIYITNLTDPAAASPSQSQSNPPKQ